MKQIQSYTYTIAGGASIQIPAPNENFYLIAASGPVTVRGDTFGRLQSLVAGQGLKGVPFNRLEVIDESGSSNTFTILLTPNEFVNQVFSGSVSIVQSSADAIRRAEEPSGVWVSNATVAANTPLTVFAPGGNTAGAILLDAGAVDSSAGAIAQCLLTKASAPASVVDGDVCAMSKLLGSGGTNYVNTDLPKPVRIPAGVGLYFISSGAGSAGALRFARYKLL